MRHVVKNAAEEAIFNKVKGGYVYWDLKKKGKPIPSNDIWVAASAMRHGLALFTYDEHFKSVDGLLLREGD